MCDYAPMPTQLILSVAKESAGMSIDYSHRDYENETRGSAVDRLLAYLTRLFVEEPVAASVSAGLILGALTNSGLAIFIGAGAAYALTEPLRRSFARR